MKILGVDPAVKSPTGLCLVEDGAPVDWLELRTNPKDDLDRRIAGLAKAVGVQIAGCGAEVVAIEQPYVPTWLRGKELAAKAKDAMDLGKLVTAITAEAGRLGAQVILVDPADGFRALTGSAKGDKRVHVVFANLRRGRMPKLKDNEHHIADSFGIALAGEARVKHEERMA